MSKLLRYYQLGHTYFITSVTFHRAPILIEHSDLFFAATSETSRRIRFNLDAWVLLPDHFHLLITPMEQSPCEILKRLKLIFAYGYRQRMGQYRGRVWQPRFWDRIIRNSAELAQHMKYIRDNPMNHGFVNESSDWKYSSFCESAPEFECPYMGELHSDDTLNFGE
jgi:putative transposase